MDGVEVIGLFTLPFVWGPIYATNVLIDGNFKRFTCSFPELSHIYGGWRRTQHVV